MDSGFLDTFELASNIHAHTYYELMLSVTFAFSFAGLSGLLRAANSGFHILDNSILNILLYLQMMGTYPEQITYLIYSLHSFVCIIRHFFCVRKLYTEQRKELSYENDPS